MADERDLVGTTDCLEAIGVVRGWKNALFVIAVICLCMLQICFWVVDSGVIEPNSVPAPDKVEKTLPKIIVPKGISMLAAAVEVNMPQAAEAKEDVNGPATGQANANVSPAAKPRYRNIPIKFEYIAWIVRVCNFVLVFSMVFYSLMLLLGLKISLIGRLGGINHITRAFILSLVVVVLILPWQQYFGSVVTGLIYTPGQLLSSKALMKSDHIVLTIALYYLRYCGLWVLTLAVLIFAQVRSMRWTKATMRRLGVM